MEGRCGECGGPLVATSEGEVCSDCGLVARHASQLVAEAIFDEAGRGHFGTFVPEAAAVGEVDVNGDGTGDGGGGGGGVGGVVGAAGRAARDRVLAQGRREMERVAGGLSVQAALVLAGTRVLQLAQQASFTRGRRFALVCSACLYVVCRQHRTDHMLVDFADFLGASVFALGAVFLKLIRVVSLANFPLVDPALYMQRFAVRFAVGSSDATRRQHGHARRGSNGSRLAGDGPKTGRREWRGVGRGL